MRQIRTTKKREKNKKKKKKKKKKTKGDKKVNYGKENHKTDNHETQKVVPSENCLLILLTSSVSSFILLTPTIKQ